MCDSPLFCRWRPRVAGVNNVATRRQHSLCLSVGYRSAYTVSPVREAITLQQEKPRRFRRNMISGASRGCTPGSSRGKWSNLMPRKASQVALTDAVRCSFPRLGWAAAVVISCARWFRGMTVLSKIPWYCPAATGCLPCRSACPRRRCRRAWLPSSRIPRFSSSRLSPSAR